MNPHWGGVDTPPTGSPLGWLFNTPLPQREFILSVFHRQQIDYRPNHQTLFLILTVESEKLFQKKSRSAKLAQLY